ncbi:MAG: hypothetical protein KDJ90_14440 [Nitratireductor sp.]|nr:hypothetical protein [Nitratireductor sp.]
MTEPRGGNGKRWLIIPLEVKVREFVPRLLVAAIAADRGYDVLIGHDRVVRRLAGHLPRGIMFDKALGVKTDRKVHRYARLGYRLTAFDEESTGLYPNPDMFFRTRLSHETLSLASRYFVLSDIVRDMAVERYPDLAERIVTTGMPRSDIWREAFRGLYEAERDRISRTHGKFILFNSNFGIVVHARRGRFLENQKKRHEKHHSGATAYFSRMEEQAGANLDAFLEMLPKLREWFPDYKLIVRPHPAEDVSFWKERLGGIGGVEIHADGIVAPWILASSVLVHHGCTTGIEAGLMGKPHVMYAPHRDDHHDTELMRTFAPMVRDHDTLRATLGDILAGSNTHQKPRESLEKYFASLIGPLASERIVDQFDGIDVPSSTLPVWLPLMRFAPRHLVARYWPRPARARAYARQKWSGADLAEVRQILKTHACAAELTHDVRADEVFPQLFHLRRGE